MMHLRTTRPTPVHRLVSVGTWATVVTLGLTWAVPARAVIIIGPSDPNTGRPEGGQNTSAPSGPLANSGYQFEGSWQGLTGTVIGPNAFITAAHAGGGVGNAFVFNGQSYTTTAEFVDPKSPDLAIWTVNGTFNSWAPIYSGSSEVGSSLITFGRSGPPGPSTSNGVTLNGWEWTGGGTTLTWGTNVVTSAGPIQNVQLLSWLFDRTLGPNTGSLATGDSGGGTFILVNGTWMLAAVNFAADGPYNTNPGNSPGTSFSASLWDTRGLYLDGDTSQISGPNALPSASYASRLSTELPFIDSVIGVPEPSAVALFSGGLCILVLVLAARRRAASTEG
jgi:hypothetical protein